MWRLLAIAVFLSRMLAADLGAAQSINSKAIDNNAIYGFNKNFVLKIRASGLDGGAVESGTGVIISPAGHVLTALHVIGGRKDIEGRRFEIMKLDKEGMAYRIDVDVVVLDVRPNLDLALLQITSAETNLSYVEVRTDKPTGTPLLVAIVWNPVERIPRWFSGDMGVTNPGLQGDRLTINMAVVPGNSGAPVFDTTGRLVGIISNQLNAGLDNRVSTAAPMWAAKDLLPVRSASDAARCRAQKREYIEDRRPFQREASVECRGDQQREAQAEFVAQKGYMIEGIVSHEDEANDYGWVDSAEYGPQDAQGHITRVKVKVECRRRDRDGNEPGQARTKLLGAERKIWTQEDDAEVERQCHWR